MVPNVNEEQKTLPGQNHTETKCKSA